MEVIRGTDMSRRDSMRKKKWREERDRMILSCEIRIMLMINYSKKLAVIPRTLTLGMC
jgi:hypothetical protein